MRTIRLVLTICWAAVLLAGCSEDNETPAFMPTAPVTTVPGIPPPPRLGAVQVDRMGRAAVNTALTNPFFRETVAAEESQHEVILDDYNAASDPSEWVPLFSSLIAGNLAILDSLDGVCGNQLLAGPTPVAGRYKALADIFADDQLFVNTASGTCTQYLAVEAIAAGVSSNDCGGRTPLYNTIDVTYSVVALGAFTGVTNGVTRDADGVASVTAFPFLDRPVP
jgi:hypothetical protein